MQSPLLTRSALPVVAAGCLTDLSAPSLMRRARESILHMLAQSDEWLTRHLRLQEVE